MFVCRAQLGIRSAMPMSKAIRMCGTLIVVPPRHNLYSEASKA
jgi:nucleotidyltransferase/DNA polymerase involved in DNA repair